MACTRSPSRMCQRLALSGLVLTFAVSPSAGDDQESAPVATAVPAEHAALGRVYYLVGAKAPQVTFRSNARAEKFKGTSSGLAGYVVAPVGEAVSRVKLAAGVFRLPVLSLDTGKDTMNEHMRAERWLDEKAHPEIAFTLSDVKDIELTKEREDSTIYKAKLVGTMSLVGTEKELTVTARITLKPESDKTRRIAPGDLMTIRSSFFVVLSEFGIGIGDEAIERGRVAETIKIDVNLTLSTQPPIDKT